MQETVITDQLVLRLLFGLELGLLMSCRVYLFVLVPLRLVVAVVYMAALMPIASSPLRLLIPMVSLRVSPRSLSVCFTVHSLVLHPLLLPPSSY
jgi:hypothetical protein